jgi:hypothetical protein
MAKPATIAEYVATIDRPLREVADAVRAVVDAELPEAEGVVWHGHPVWRVGGEPAVLLKAHPNHVTFGFWRGQALADPSGRLEPGTGEMASVKLRALEEVDRERFADWLRQVGDPAAAGRA